MEVVCIDSHFSQEALSFYSKFGVTTPIEGSIYTIREIVSHSIGVKGVLLVEIDNPSVPIVHAILGEIKREPTWSLNRFTTLLGEKVEANSVQEVGIN